MSDLRVLGNDFELQTLLCERSGTFKDSAVGVGVLGRVVVLGGVNGLGEVS